jgi:hypothetical protein
VLDTPIAIGHAVTTRQAGRTSEELQPAVEYARLLIIRHLAAAERMEAGQMPACDYQYPDGSWCDHDATSFRMTNSGANCAANSAEQTDPLEHIALCEQHRRT